MDGVSVGSCCWPYCTEIQDPPRPWVTLVEVVTSSLCCEESPCPSGLNEIALRGSHRMQTQCTLQLVPSGRICCFLPPPTTQFPLPTPSFPLILPRRSLARLQLIQIPPTDVHIPLVLRHAIRILLDVHRARALRLLALSAARVVQIRIHCATGLRVRVGGLFVLRLFSRRGRGGSAAEEAADGVPD